MTGEVCGQAGAAASGGYEVREGLLSFAAPGPGRRLAELRGSGTHFPSAGFPLLEPAVETVFMHTGRCALVVGKRVRLCEPGR